MNPNNIKTRDSISFRTEMWRDISTFLLNDDNIDANDDWYRCQKTATLSWRVTHNSVVEGLTLPHRTLGTL